MKRKIEVVRLVGESERERLLSPSLLKQKIPATRASLKPDVTLRELFFLRKSQGIL